MKTHAAKSARRSHAHDQSHATLSLSEAISRIEASSYRLTRPRRALLEVILKLVGKPFSVPDIEKRLKGKNGCDSVTIYRTLPIFVELGLLEKCDFSDEMSHYEVRPAGGDERHHHHHVVCTGCRKVDALEFCLVDAQEQILKRLGYQNLKHRLEFSGLCPSCA